MNTKTILFVTGAAVALGALIERGSAHVAKLSREKLTESHDTALREAFEAQKTAGELAIAFKKTDTNEEEQKALLLEYVVKVDVFIDALGTYERSLKIGLTNPVGSVRVWELEVDRMIRDLMQTEVYFTSDLNSMESSNIRDLQTGLRLRLVI